LEREDVLKWFGSKEGYQGFHEVQQDENFIKNDVIEFD
jgi:hypothetical protein